MNWTEKFMAHLTANTTLSGGTILQHASRVRCFGEWMASLSKAQYMRGNAERVKAYGPPAAADAIILRRYFGVLAEKHPADYRQHIKASLRHYYKWLVSVDAIKEMPDLDIPIRKNGLDRGKDENVLNEKDIAALRRHFNPSVDAKDKDTRDNLIFQCLMNLGVRKSELLMLRYSDFDNDIGQVNIRSTKTEGKSKYGGNRIMPLSPSLYRLVKDFQKTATDSDLIFHIGGHSVWKMFKEAGAALGLD